ncbi:unnamed protein product [Lepeophtheirus salmonis]|uniref:(salmon louse) hypothetical protein n=1 Tax=Lepeophtheirus salmonis TaxID=72036 RepID=A0A0K2TJT9_LEPSM|nr:unnamed protein product [Lepeophtheirus salmonis]CAF2962069.1 unnamed protein product [Lepeophtheirus salmonis]
MSLNNFEDSTNIDSSSSGLLCLLCGCRMASKRLRRHIRERHNVTEPGIFDLLLHGDDSKLQTLRKYRCKTCGFFNQNEAFVLSPHRSHTSKEGGYGSEVLCLVPVLKRISQPSPLYECGEQVIVKREFFLWWPAIVLQRPGHLDDLKSHYDPIKRRYHVGYFSNKSMLREWVPESDILPFSSIGSKSKFNCRDYTAALSLADHCETWSNEERRLKFCFTSKS